MEWPPFHLVDVSPWPLLGAMGAMTTMVGLVKWFHFFNIKLFILGMLITMLVMYQWWLDVTREGTFQGLHTFQVTMGLRFLLDFLSILSLKSFPFNELGKIWPPKGIEVFNPMQIPLLNTPILLTSGLTVTWAHHNLMEDSAPQATQSLIITVMLVVYFSILQGFEYMEAPFTISDGVYGSSFVMTTGFHGLHVIIGTTFLLVCLIRHLNNHFSCIHHFGFEAATWYRYFVDVLWLFIYISIYWWGS